MSNTTFKLFADKMGGTSSTNYIGTLGEIFYDQNVGTLKLSDGVTAGGTAITVASAPTDYSQTSLFFVDPLRVDSYASTGTVYRPFKTLATAYAAAVSAGKNDTNPAFIVLMGNITESITLTQGGIWLIGAYGSGTHGSFNLTGTITINGAGANSVANHFQIANLRVIAPNGGHGILFTGTNPQKVFMRDIWIDANTTKTCVYADNTGTASTLHFEEAHLTHSGSGDIYCVDVVHGTVTMSDIETSGTVQVAAVRSGATLTIDGSEIDANNGAALEVYGGTVAITNSMITNAQANSNGIALNTAGSVATLGNVVFNIPAGTGKALYAVAGTAAYYANVTFYPSSNQGKSAAITPVALANAFT